MQVLFMISGLLYLAVVPLLFISWLEAFHQDQDNLTFQEQRVSMIVIAVASVLWVITLPFAYIELLDKYKRSSRTAQLYQTIIENQKLQSEPQMLVSDDEIKLSNY